ncbi:membrane protein [Pseudonocardia kongjuensis]|uniref:Membrane protein n=1 Tax=Pseudonocardia kongjuensis TaxID=102227 RepID=A0ABP4IL38_9PSEU
MAVNLPTSADVKKLREQTAEQAEVVRTPLLAVLGAGDYAYTTVTKAVADVRSTATKRAEEVQGRVQELPEDLKELRGKLSSENLRKQVEEFRAQAEDVYVGFAQRGEKAWGKIRKQPQVKQAFATVEDLTEKFDARVDEFVDETHDAAEKALETVTTQTRSVGEKVARRTQAVAGQAAEAVTEVSKDAAEAIEEAGDEVAGTTRSTTRKAAAKTDPKTNTGARTAAARKPATRRSTTGTTKK